MVRTVALSLSGMLVIGLAGWGGSPGRPAPQDDGPDRFRNLPSGWAVTESVVIPAQQLPAFSQKLGGQVVRGTNTTLSVGGQRLKVNTIACKTDEDAAKVPPHRCAAVGRHGRGSYPTAFAGLRLSSSTARSASTQSIPIATRVSRVALPRCGVRTTFSSGSSPSSTSGSRS